MLRLARYLKPYIPLILLSVVLLFVQATADLSLPDYMAKIVNTGIQQGGVETAVPQAIRQSTMDKAVLFLSEEEKADVLSAYTLVEQNDPAYLKQYPAVANEPIYVLNAVDQSTIDRLNPVIGKGLMAVSGIETMMADPEKSSEVTQQSSMLAALPAGTNVFDFLQGLPALVRNPILKTMNDRFAALDSKMIVQAGATALKGEYTALGMDTTAMQNNFIISAGVTMLLLSLLSGVSTVTVGLLAARTAAGFARDLRGDVFKKVESFSNHEFDKFSVSSLITRSTNDVTQLQMVIVMLVRIVFYAPILATGGILKATHTDSSMWWIIALGVVALISLIIGIFSTALPKFRIIQDLVDRLNLVTREDLSGMMVVRAFNTQSFEEQRFDKANQNLTNTNLSVNRTMVLMMPGMMLIMNFMTLLIIWVGAHQVAAAQMQVGDMIAFMQYALQVVMAFLMLSIMFIILPRAAVSGDRIADVLATGSSIKDPANPKTFSKPFDGTIEFRNVSFRYPGAEADVLHNINFTAKPGETTAFIGSTGSGKSTLVNLIPRFYDVTDGAILIDGMDIREVTQHDLRDKIGYIPQKAMLFSGTVETNLRYADENISAEAMSEAADIAQATNFINEKPDGFATEIAQGGTNVSGGQRQRLSIARALAKHAPIYVFDDSFSALDFKTDAALRKALKEKTGNSALLIVTQRVSTVKTAEQIIVLDEGKIVGKGTHDELMATCEIYKEIALSQMGMGEALLS